jgi:fibronectin type 3 domain-containing protein
MMNAFMIRGVGICIILSGLVACGSSDSGGGSPSPSLSGATGAVTLQWDPVTANDLAGYNVYQSTSSGSLGTLAKGDIAPSTTTYTVGNLQSGATYYFVVKSFDTSGNESSASNQVSKTIQ